MLPGNSKYCVTLVFNDYFLFIYALNNDNCKIRFSSLYSRQDTANKL